VGGSATRSFNVLLFKRAVFAVSQELTSSRIWYNVCSLANRDSLPTLFEQGSDTKCVVAVVVTRWHFLCPQNSYSSPQTKHKESLQHIDTLGSWLRITHSP
jgi:hypothetical protein